MTTHQGVKDPQSALFITGFLVSVITDSSVKVNNAASAPHHFSRVSTNHFKNIELNPVLFYIEAAPSSPLPCLGSPAHLSLLLDTHGQARNTQHRAAWGPRGKGALPLQAPRTFVSTARFIASLMRHFVNISKAKLFICNGFRRHWSQVPRVSQFINIIGENRIRIQAVATHRR